MATNPYFNNFNSAAEQDLLNDLIAESIKIYGVDMYYIPRDIKRYDKLLGEDANSEYTRAVSMEFYVKSFDEFKGDGNFMSKFGLQIRDQAVFVVSQRSYLQEVGSVIGQTRPNEGDLIFFTLNKKCFRVMYVNKHDYFYPLGTLPTWELTVELFEYSNEKIATGIPDIDRLQRDFSLNILDYSITDESGTLLTDQESRLLLQESYDMEEIDPAADNDTIQTGTENFPLGSDDFLDFTERNPFSEVNP